MRLLTRFLNSIEICFLDGIRNAAESMGGTYMPNHRHFLDMRGMAVCNGMPVCCHSSVFDRWSILHSIGLFMLCIGCGVEFANH